MTTSSTVNTAFNFDFSTLAYGEAGVKSQPIQTLPPVEAVAVRNAKGYSNLVITSDTFRKNGRRFKITSVDKNGVEKASVFISAVALKSVIQGLTLVEEYGQDVHEDGVESEVFSSRPACRFGC